MSIQLSECPICGDNYLQQDKIPVGDELGTFAYNCRRCGDFRANNRALTNSYLRGTRHLVSAWIRRQNRIGVSYPRVAGDKNEFADDWFKGLERLGFPQMVTEKLDALLVAYADIAKDEVGKRIKVHLFPHLISEVAARSLEEVKELSQLLHELNYVDFSDDTAAKVKADGWHRIDVLRKNRDSSDSVFIAVWYAPCTAKYCEATISTVKYCGYRPYIVNQHDFSGFIMDQIVLLIRQSRFLIADFTCRAESCDQNNQVINGVRGGVYWEAGFAYGMGKPVIHTCEDNEDAKCRIHFDLKQYNTIYWKPSELANNIDIQNQTPNFAEKLASRILALVGRGSYQETS